MSSTGKKFFIVCFSLILVLSIISLTHAQTQTIIYPPPKVISYCGAACVSGDTATGACPLVKADTYFTVVNPAYKNWITTDCVSNVWLPCMYASVKMVVYDWKGNFVGAASATIPPKGLHNFSLAEILIKYGKIELDGILKKYTVEITWRFPCIYDKIVAAVDSICPIRVIPDIPIRIQVKEIIFYEFHCLYSIRQLYPEYLAFDTNIIKTWSETSLGPQVLYPKGIDVIEEVRENQ